MVQKQQNSKDGICHLILSDCWPCLGTRESHMLRTQNSFTLHITKYSCTTRNVQQEMYNKKCLQLCNQNWDVLDTAAPIVQKVQPQIRKEIENTLI